MLKFEGDLACSSTGSDVFKVDAQWPSYSTAYSICVASLQSMEQRTAEGATQNTKYAQSLNFHVSQRACGSLRRIGILITTRRLSLGKIAVMLEQH